MSKSHQTMIHEWMNDTGYSKDQGNLHTWPGTLRVNGTTLASRWMVDGKLIVLTSDKWPETAGFNSYYGYVSMVCGSVPGDVVHIHMPYIPDCLWRTGDEVPVRTVEEFTDLIRRFLGGFMRSEHPTQSVAPYDAAGIKRMKARRHDRMRHWNRVMEENAVKLRRLQDELQIAWPGGGIDDLCSEIDVCVRALEACVHSEQALEEARAWSDKWQAVDADRVAKHGAFGRVSWEERQRRNREREERRRQEAAEREAEERKIWTLEYLRGVCDRWRAGGGFERVPGWVKKEWPDEVKALQAANPGDMLRVSMHNGKPRIETSRDVQVPGTEAMQLLRMLRVVWARMDRERERLTAHGYPKHGHLMSTGYCSSVTVPIPDMSPIGVYSPEPVDAFGVPNIPRGCRPIVWKAGDGAGDLPSVTLAGYYKLEWVSEDVIKVGCHHVYRTEVERVGVELERKMQEV